MTTTTLLDHREGLSDCPGCFEKSHAHHCVGEIAQVQRALHLTKEPILGQNKNGDDAFLIEVRGHFVELIDEILVTGHRIEISIQTVDDDQPATTFHCPTNAHAEFPGRDFRRVDLLHINGACLNVPCN